MSQWYYLLNGQQRGPVSREEIIGLVSRGQLRLNDYVWSDGMPNWVPIQNVPGLHEGATPQPGYGGGGAAYPGGAQAYAQPRRRYLRPHRGSAVLTLGILGLVVCGICGIIAWVMGNTDMVQIRAGRMDRSGEGMTNAGRICGIIGTILFIVQSGFVLIWLVMMFSITSSM